MLPHKIGPVRIAEKSGAPTSEGDEWCNEVLHDRIHHGSDGHPHDHGHRQVNHITAQDEISETLEHRLDLHSIHTKVAQ